MVKLSNAYAVKSEIKDHGGKWDGREWSLTDEQFVALVLAGQASFERSNKRDRAFGVAMLGIGVAVASDSVRYAPSGRWTGCSCGSREGNPRGSDCASCAHDA